MDTSVAAVIVAGGSGTRLGHSLPKAFVPLAGQPLMMHTLHTFVSCNLFSFIHLVVSDAMRPRAQELCEQSGYGDAVRLVTGGAQRWNSVHHGVRDTDPSLEWVVVHDAARPFCSHTVIETLLGMRARYRAAVTATPLVDTIRTFQGDRAGQTIDRTTLVRVGTPQLFHRATLLELLEHADPEREDLTDEAVLMEQHGVAVGIAAGDPLNFKVTTPEDLELAEALYARRSSM